MEHGRASVFHEVENANRNKDFRRATRHSIMVRALRLLLPLAAAGALGLYFIPSEISVTINGQKATIESVELTSDKLKMINPKLIGFSKKNGSYVITADHALQDINNPDVIELVNIVADIKNKKRGWTRIISNNGLFYTKKEFLTLTGNIQVTSESGMKADMEIAEIDMKTHTITSKKPVVIEILGSTVHSREMTIDTSTRKIDFFKDVKVHIKESSPAPATGTTPKRTQTASLALDRNQPIDITSSNMTVFDEQKLAHFHGDVTVLQGGYQIKSNHLKVYYTGDGIESKSQTQSDIRSIEAIENVRIRGSDGRSATSNALRFDTKAETLTMTGNVILTQGKNILKGNELFVNMKTGQSLFRPGGRVHGKFINESQTAKATKKPAPAKTKKPQKSQTSKIGIGQISKFNVSEARDKPINIAANTLLLDEQKNQATFQGKVVTDQGGYKINSDKLIVYYEGSANSPGKSDQNTNVKKINAMGNVTIVSPDGQSAKSQWAEFDVKANTIVIGGNVVLLRGQDVLTGDRMVIDLKTGRSQMETEAIGNSSGKNSRVRALFIPKQKKKALSKDKPETPAKQ